MSTSPIAEDPRAAQARRDAKARADYEALAPTLSPEVRAILSNKRGVVRPDDSTIGSHSDHDVSDLQIGTPSPDMAATLDTIEDELTEEFDLTPGQANGIASWYRERVKREADGGLAIRLARVVGVLLGSENLKLSVYALAYATGTASANGLASMRKAVKEILKSNGEPVTVAALSKRACWLVGFLQLPTPPGLKRPEAVAAYSKAQKEKHWRRKRGRFSKMLARVSDK